MSPEKRYGDYTDPENEYVKMLPYVQFWLETYSKTRQQHNFNSLVDLAFYLQEKFKVKILKAKPSHLLHYFREVIDKKTTLKKGKKVNISKATKIKYRETFNSYYGYVKDYKEMEDDHRFKNPVPPSKIWDFSGTTLTLYDLEFDYQSLTLDIIKRILHHIYFTVESERIFIFVSLIIYSGARVSEVAHIKLANLDLKNRWFITKVKSLKSQKRDGFYFFPEFFREELDIHIKKLILEYENPIYLFQNGASYLNPKSIQRHLRKVKKALGLTCYINPHAYRDFLNTKRADMGLQKPYKEFLLNQTVGGVNASSYMKKYKNRLVLRDLYDKYNPFPELIKPRPLF